MKQNTFTKRDIIAIIINLFIFAVELVIAIIKIPERGASIFSYYTTLSNFTAMVSGFIFLCSAAGRFRHLGKCKTILRYYSTCMLSLTFIIVIAVLMPMALSANVNPSFLFVGDTAPIHHLINPVLSLVSLIFLEDNRELKKTQPLFMLCLTLCYAVVIIILNLTRTIVGPYPFFQVYDMPVWASILWIAGISAFTYLLNYLIYRFSKTK